MSLSHSSLETGKLAVIPYNRAQEVPQDFQGQGKRFNDKGHRVLGECKSNPSFKTVHIPQINKIKLKVTRRSKVTHRRVPKRGLLVYTILPFNVAAATDTAVAAVQYRPIPAAAVLQQQ